MSELARSPFTVIIEIDADELALLFKQATAAHARSALRRKFAAQVDPDFSLDPDERERRVALVAKEHAATMGRASAEARRVRMQAVAS